MTVEQTAAGPSSLEEQLAQYKLLAAKVAPLPNSGYDLTDLQLSGSVSEDKERLRSALYAATDFPSALLADIVQQAMNTEGTPRELLSKTREAMGGLAPPRVAMGILPADVVRERERLIKQRVAARISELEKKLSDLPEDDPSRTKLLIELKSMQLWDVRRKVRADVLQRAQAGAAFDAGMNRSEMELLGRQISLQGIRPFRPPETPAVPSESQTPLGRNRGLCSLLSDHFKNWGAETKNKSSLWTKVNRAVSSYHSAAEKEEQKRQERVSKERIKALKADDEEAYLKLLDQQKDTRLAYLLNQTNEFLGTLSAQVRAQQADGEETAVEGESNADYYQAAHRTKETVEEQPSILIGGKLKEYQLKGLEWLVSLYNNRLNGILADEMGLGKTIQAISLISHLMERKNLSGPYLVIVPLSTMTNWSVEFDKWAPSIVKVEYKGTPAHRKNLQATLRHGRFNVLLTTYEYIIKDRPFLSKFKWLYMIIDEGHRMKNSHSKLSLTLSQYYAARFRVILTGTPLQNSLPELWSLLNFVLPRIFNSSKTFEEWFNAPFANSGTGESVELNEEETLLIIRRLHKVLRPFLLRRLKKDVEADLPDKIELIMKCPMSALQHRLYAIIKQQGVDDAASSSFKRLNNTIMQLRKICNHPFTFEEVENVVNPSRINNDLLHRVSGKFELLHRVLPKFKATGHRVLMFFQMTAVITIMEDFLNMMGMKYLRLDGSTKAEDRTTMLHAFNDPKSPYFIFLLSTRAGGLGLNLQSADTVIIFDSDWNPHQDLQAQDRAHRIGQTRQVRIFRLVTVDSVEEYILERAQFKLSLDGKVIQAGKFDNKSTNEEREQMLRALLEEEREKNNEEEDFSDDDLNESIARNDFELEQFRKMDLENPPHREGRLITFEELPAEYREQPKQRVVDPALAEMGRRKKQVNYDESMSDNQWLKTIDAENSSDVASPAKRIRLKVATPNSINPAFFSLLDSLEAACDDTGRSRSDIFAVLPDAKDYPDYYKVIKRPLSMACIRNNLCQGRYIRAEELQADLDAMFGNAMRYNAEGSLVYEDAAWLMEYSHDLIAEINNTSEDDDDEMQVDNVHDNEEDEIENDDIEEDDYNDNDDEEEDGDSEFMQE